MFEKLSQLIYNQYPVSLSLFVSRENEEAKYQTRYTNILHSQTQLSHLQLSAFSCQI